MTPPALLSGARDVLADSFSGGSAALGIAVLAAFVGAVVGCRTITTTGFRRREVTTRLSPAELAAVFEQKVCGSDWSIPMDDPQKPPSTGLSSDGTVLFTRVAADAQGSRVAADALPAMTPL